MTASGEAAVVEPHITYCRICPAHCGIEVEIEDGVATRVVGDEAHPLTHGFTCAKGRRIGDLHADAFSFPGATAQKRIINESGPEWARMLLEEGVEAVLLVPV